MLPIRPGSILATVMAAVPATMLAVIGIGCQGTPAPEPPSEEAAVLRGWHYDVTLDADLTVMDTRVCFSGRPPRRFIPGRESAFDYLDGAWVDGTDRELVRDQDNRALDLGGLDPNSCIRYTLDLHALAERGGRRALRHGRAIAASAGTWLWRPWRIPDGAQITARIRRPASVGLSVPWDVVGDGDRDDPDTVFQLDNTVFRWFNTAVFGGFTLDRFTHRGGTIELVTLDGPLEASPAGLRNYVIDGADSVSSIYGRLPVDRVQVVVVPVQWGGEAVHFGRVGRGGGTGVTVLVDSEATDQDLPGGWTTIHEFQHVGMPFAADPWVSEGFASYYAELQRTRMGHRTEQEGWTALERAFGRGRSSGRGTSLQRSSDGMHEQFAYQRVYWGGAAIAFMTDVRMRIDSKGRLGLDDALREFHRCCRDAKHMWPADTILGKLDAWYGKPLFSEAAAEVLPKVRFPDLTDTYRQLGVDFKDGRAVLDENHPNAAIRRAIMAPQDGR